MVIDLVSNMDPNVFDLSVVCLTADHSPAGRRMGGFNFPVYVLNQNNLCRRVIGIIKTTKLLRRISPSIVHSHNFSANAYGRVASILARVPIIIASLHTYSHSQEKKIIRRVLNSILIRKTDCLVVVSESIRNNLIGKHKIDSTQIDVIHNGIDVTKFREMPLKASSRIRFGVPAEKRVVGTLANLRPVKRIDVFLQAARMILLRYPETHFLIGGDGVLRPVLEQYAKESGIYKNIIFAGEISNVPEFLSALDIYVSTSDREGLSLSLLEAMGAGLPCIATRVGGNEEIIIDGTTGFIVKPRNIRETVDAVCKLLENPILTQELGDLGRKRVFAHFTVENMAIKAASLYENLLSNECSGKLDRR